MICQECEEEYLFETLKFDPESCRAFGTFRCGCEAKLVLPEEDCLRLDLLDDEGKEQLRHLRLVGFRLRLDSEKRPGRIYLKAFQANQEILLRYLQDLSNAD